MNATAATVLTVEDNPITRADLRLVLEEAGFAVCDDAHNGLEAVELARSHSPDVILLDLNLPHLDGIEATRRILAERAVPIVALTGRSRERAEEALEAGASSYVLKPFDGPALVTAIREALAVPALEAARAESRAAIARVLEMVGYPAELATELEEQSNARGRHWRVSYDSGA